MQRSPPRTLLSWTDRGPARPHHSPRPLADQGPLLRLIDAGEAHYERVILLTTPETEQSSADLVLALRERVEGVVVHRLDVADPSDYRALIEATRALLPRLPEGPLDVVLSAGTPQAQAVWVLLVKAELLAARMLQVIPPAFVPVPHPSPVREVRLDFAGFPQIRALQAEVTRLRAQVGDTGLLGESPAMVLLRDRARAIARSDVPVLILGETGTGKELVARAVHAQSRRAAGPFVAENCGAFAESLLQSELFGHEKGAFTGAAARRKGLFELADGGTLLLDEIGEMPLPTQASLLRVLQEGQLRRVGGERPVKVDVRVLAATHRDLPALVREGRFREDLYYRLHGATLTVPPLRERMGDLELLVGHFLGGAALQPTAAAWAALRSWRWPGNVRELRAEVTRWTVFCTDRVGLADLSAALQGPAEGAPRSAAVGLRTLGEVVEEAEQAAISAALAASGGSLSGAARLLGIDRNTLKRKRPVR